MAIDGTYAVAYCGSIGLGVAMLNVNNGQVIGHDYVGSVIAGIATELPNGEIDLMSPCWSSRVLILLRVLPLKTCPMRAASNTDSPRSSETAHRKPYC